MAPLSMHVQTKLSERFLVPPGPQSDLGGIPGPLQVLKKVGDDDGGQLMREEFKHNDFTYELLFQLMTSDAPAPRGG